MSDNEHDRNDEEHPAAREGAFDAQMMFSAPFVEAPQPIASIVKRDGSSETFDKNKITEAIFRAAQAIGGGDHDRAASLASGVTIYLSKILAGQPPTVDQVDDAVEKVLIEMGHARTALTYARYRDRRARVRSLRQGDLRPILNEMAEARRGPEHGRAFGISLFVRTSRETLAEWDRAKIVAALVRETGLDESFASLIAVEVEQQIETAGLKTLTAPLIRELVSAKLFEHGLESHGRRHMRLGVPLYDAERIICGPNPDGSPLDPDATGRVLAESVKREFALSQIFSPDVAEAHARGDVHVHDLGRVDRLHTGVQSLEAIARFGMGLPESKAFSRPPRHVETLLAQMVNSSAELQKHFAGTVAWDAVNVYFAPFMDGFDKRTTRQLAQMLIYEYAFRAVAHREYMPPTEIGVCWNVPLYLKDAEAVGPGGKGTERSYSEYTSVFREFAKELFDVFREGGARGMAFPSPVPVVHITPALFKTDGHESFLQQVAEAASLRGNVGLEFERGPREDGLETWEPRDTVVHRVTLNLPRAAYAASTEPGFFAELDRLIEIAMRAHVQKKDFIERLFSLNGLGPLGLLAIHREGRSYLDMAHASYLIGLTGLNECLKRLAGSALHESEAAVELGLRTAAHVANRCAEWSARLDLRIVPAHSTDRTVSRRFADLDVDSFPACARETVKINPKTHEFYYTPGLGLDESCEASPIERVRIEGRFHERIHAGAETRVRMPDPAASQRSVAYFIQKVYYQTSSRRIAISR